MHDLPREVSPAGHATGGEKGVPGHGVGARPASHGAGEKGDSGAWFGGVRVSTALHGCTRQYSCEESLEGFLPRVIPDSPTPIADATFERLVSPRHNRLPTHGRIAEYMRTHTPEREREREREGSAFPRIYVRHIEE